MAKAVLAGIITLAASTALAQTDSTSDQAGAGGPANLCQELLAFMEAPPEETAPAAPAQAADAEEEPGEEGASPEETAAAGGEDSEPASGEAVPPQSSEESSSSQEITGQSGPATESPDPNEEPVEPSTAEDAPQKNTMSAPVPADQTSTPKDSVFSLDEAQELADANDIAACQSAARELRLAGVAVPPPLLALTALDLQYHQTADPESEGENPPEAQQDAAPATEAPAPQAETD
jgi:hypothetical protein